jgi:F-box-like
MSQHLPLHPARPKEALSSRLLAVPPEIITHIYSNLEFRDLVRFCATCRQTRALVNLQKLIWLIDNFRHGRLDRETVIASETNPLLFSHALVEICRQYGRFRRDLNLLIRRGASFGSVPAGKLVEQFFLRYGPGRQLGFLLRNGASLNQADGGIDALLETTWRRAGAWRRRIDFLTEQGASLCNIKGGIDALLMENFVQSGPSRRTEFLLENGASLRRVGSLLLPACLERRKRGHAPWTDLNFLTAYGASPDTPGELNLLLEQTLKGPGILWKLVIKNGAVLEQVPGGIHSLLEEVLQIHGVGDRIHLLLNHGASFLQTPKGIHKLLYDMVHKGDSESARFLFQQGAHLKAANGGINTVLEDIYRQRGPSAMVYLLLEHGADLQHVPSGINTLLQDVYLYRVENGGRWADFRESLFLLEHGASFAQVPRGLNQLLEDVVRQLKWVGNETDVLIRRGASLRQVPSGIDTLLRDILSTDSPRQLLLRFLCEGASLAESRINGVLADCYWHEGFSENVRFLVEQCGASFQKVPEGIDGLLERVFLEGFSSRDNSREAYLIVQGASFDRCPSGPQKLLEIVRERVRNGGYPPLRRPEEFLLENCAALRL